MQKLRSKIEESSSNVAQANIVEIPANARTFVCKNHFNLDNKGRQVITRVIISFMPNEKIRTCECGIIYKRIN